MLDKGATHENEKAMAAALATGRRDLYDLIQRHAQAKEAKAARIQKKKAMEDAKKVAVPTSFSLEDREKEAEKALEALLSDLNVEESLATTSRNQNKKKKKKKKKKEEAPDDNAAWLPLPEKRPVGWACGPSHVRIGKKTLRSLSGGREGWREGRGGEEGEARER